jgi:hypothetical protein
VAIGNVYLLNGATNEQESTYPRNSRYQVPEMGTKVSVQYRQDIVPQDHNGRDRKVTTVSDPGASPTEYGAEISE